MIEPDHIGDVAVDSGELLVIDPAYTEEQDMVLQTDDEKESQLRFTHGAAAAVKFPTLWGDGVYPVFLHRGPDGNATHVVISLDGAKR